MSKSNSQLQPDSSWKSEFAQHHIMWQYPGHGAHAAYSLWNKHADFYFNSEYLDRNEVLLERAAKALYDSLQSKLQQKPDWVITYPPFGLEISCCLARLLKCKFGYIKSLDNPELEFDVLPNERVLFCADDLHTGGSFRKVLAAVEGVGATIVTPLAVVANLSGSLDFDGYEVESLFSKTINIWNATDCPLCADGSQAVLARKNWHLFTSK